MGYPPEPAGGRALARYGLPALVTASFLALAALGVGLGLALADDSGSGAVADRIGSVSGPGEPLPYASPGTVLPGGHAGATIPPPTLPPTGLGTDPVLNREAQSCHDGDMTSCVLLYLSAYVDRNDPAYVDYGDTCAGRQPAGTNRLCTDTFPR